MPIEMSMTSRPGSTASCGSTHRPSIKSGSSSAMSEHALAEDVPSLLRQNFTAGGDVDDDAAKIEVDPDGTCPDSVADEGRVDRHVPAAGTLIGAVVPRRGILRVLA